MKKTLTTILFVITLISCGKTNEELATEQLNKARQLFENQLNEEAKKQIDSIDILFPKEIEIRRKGQILKGEIQVKELTRNINFLENEIAKIEAELPNLTKNFIFQKDSTYEKHGKFIHKRQQTFLTINRSLLKAIVDETGCYYIESIYCGEYPIKHNSIKISINDFFIESEVIPQTSAFNHSYQDENLYYEMVTYKNNNEELFQYISENIDKTIKITLVGDRKHSFLLEPADKQAISDAYNLGVALHDLIQMQQNLAGDKARLSAVENNLEINNQKVNNHEKN